ncbi:MAG: tetratricopeptide repeat protein [Thermoleophilia bacterium]|nr:tetratricopeptide repeat protein [Thermoleophilia bacterium]
MQGRRATNYLGIGMRARSAALAALGLVLAVALASVILAFSGCSDRAGQARALQEQGHIEHALSLYKEILREHPEDTEALEQASVCLLLLGRYDEALVMQERVVALVPDNAQVRVELGFNYLNHQGRPADAARVLGEAASLEPSAKNLTFWAQALIACGDEARAEAVLRKAIESEPGYARSYEILYRLLSSQGRADEAQQLLEQAAAQGITLKKTPAG